MPIEIKKTNENTHFDYESIETGYYDKIYKLNKGVQSKWHHQKFQAVKSILGDYHKHLDIGCGPGTFIGTLDAHRHSTGVDISESQIHYAQKNYGTPCHSFRRIHPQQNLPFENNTFDIITSLELVEHITLKDGQNLLQEAFRVLTPGGRIIITTPNYGSLWPILECFVNKLSKVSYKDQHIQHYKKISLKNLFNQSGFVNLDISTILLSSPFLAGLNWKFSDQVFQLETQSIGRKIGFLLVAQAQKG